MANLAEEQMQQGISIINDLIVAARNTLNKISTNDNHSVVSAARTKDGKVITGFNVHHFTGGVYSSPQALPIAT
jgi:cytidine deaminase